MTTYALHHAEAGPGDGPPLLMSGSLGTTLGMWDPQVARLADRLRIVAFDQRGHGGSPVPPGPYTIEELGGDVLALLDRLGWERASYCGLSIGGMVGMWLAVNAPERIDRLVLVCSSAHLPPASLWLERAASVREAGTTEVVADAVFERWLTPGFVAAHPDIAARLRDMLLGTPPEGYAGCCEAIAGTDLRRVIRRIRAPTLVIAGELDPATPPEHGRRIADTVPGASLVVVPGAAHLANVERPDEVSRAIAHHLDLPEAA